MDQNSTSPNPGNPHKGIGLLLSLLALIVIFVVWILGCLFGRSRFRNLLLGSRIWANDRAIGFHTADLNENGAVIGIDKETLDSFPKMLYSVKVCQSLNFLHGNELEEAEDNKCCSICLSDYKEPENVRIIPDCDHIFDMDCIDEWLRLHATCPICRTSPLPSRSSTSLAQESPPTAILTALDHGLNP